MVEKNSGVPSTVAVPLQQPERGESAPDVEVAPQAKRSRKAKTKHDTETGPVPNRDPVNAEQTAVAADTVDDTGTPIAPLVAIETEGTIATPTEKPVAIPDQKRKPKRSRPPPAIEHKRVVHYYRESRPNKGHGRRGDVKDRRNGGQSRGRHDRDEKKARPDNDDDDDDDELLSDSDWNVDSGDETDPSDEDSKSDDESDDGERVTGPNKRTVKKHEPEKEARRDDGGRFTPVHAVMQYKIV